MGVEGDTGAYLRSTMGALVLCGVPPEEQWPYTDSAWEFDEEPTPFVYAIADNFEAINYFRHDPVNTSGPETLVSVKKWLVTGIPAMFGFYVFDSFQDCNTPGGIPFPGPDDKTQGGHAIVAVGYDDDKMIMNNKTGEATEGALLIRNSWGTEWGDAGYGWLPYKYVESGLASDFWSLLSMEWVDTGRFGA